ncbi:hypothetical protein H0H93_012398 [Arthromyces matolae]|nr:hypothetical protein H0H93_012398 [Arthromyces matolae]
MIHALADAAPNLKSLTINSIHDVASQTEVRDQRDLVDAFARFKSLEILVFYGSMDALNVPNAELPSSNPLEHSEQWGTCYAKPAQCRKVASQFMVTCPRLQRLSFPVKSTIPGGDFNKVTYVRSRDSESATFQGFYMIDTSGWWMK